MGVGMGGRGFAALAQAHPCNGVAGRAPLQAGRAAGRRMSGLLRGQLTSSMPTSLSMVQLQANQRPINERVQHTHRVLHVEAHLGLGTGQHHLCQVAQVAHRLAVEFVHLVGSRGGWGGSTFRWQRSGGRIQTGA